MKVHGRAIYILPFFLELYAAVTSPSILLNKARSQVPDRKSKTCNLCYACSHSSTCHFTMFQSGNISNDNASNQTAYVRTGNLSFGIRRERSNRNNGSNQFISVRGDSVGIPSYDRVLISEGAGDLPIQISRIVKQTGTERWERCDFPNKVCYCLRRRVTKRPLSYSCGQLDSPDTQCKMKRTNCLCLAIPQQNTHKYTHRYDLFVHVKCLAR